MTQWDVVTVIIAIVGLALSVGAPIIKLNTSITKLTTKMDGMEEGIDELTARNSKSHERIWKHNEEQDKQIADHEKRIVILEHDNDNTAGRTGGKER